MMVGTTVFRVHAGKSRAAAGERQARGRAGKRTALALLSAILGQGLFATQVRWPDAGLKTFLACPRHRIRRLGPRSATRKKCEGQSRAQGTQASRLARTQGWNNRLFSALRLKLAGMKEPPPDPVRHRARNGSSKRALRAIERDRASHSLVRALRAQARAVAPRSRSGAKPAPPGEGQAARQRAAPGAACWLQVICRSWSVAFATLLLQLWSKSSVGTAHRTPSRHGPAAPREMPWPAKAWTEDRAFDDTTAPIARAGRCKHWALSEHEVFGGRVVFSSALLLSRAGPSHRSNRCARPLGAGAHPCPAIAPDPKSVAGRLANRGRHSRSSSRPARGRPRTHAVPMGAKRSRSRPAGLLTRPRGGHFRRDRPAALSFQLGSARGRRS